MKTRIEARWNIDFRTRFTPPLADKLNGMSGVSSILRQERTPVSRYTAPDEALRRLALPQEQGRSFVDLSRLSSTGLQAAIQDIDNEGKRLEQTHLRATAAINALATAETKLKLISDIQAANSKSGSSPLTRRDNQKKIDLLLKEIDLAFEDAGKGTPDLKGVKVFDGQTQLSAAKQTVDLPELSLDSLGRIAHNGQMRSLADLRSRQALDTTRIGGNAVSGGRRTVGESIKTVNDLRQKLETFATQTLRPRLGDVAEVMAGLFDTLGVKQIRSSGDADQVLVELRELTLQTTAVATAVGADGWDRQRVVDLLT